MSATPAAKAAAGPTEQAGREPFVSIERLSKRFPPRGGLFARLRGERSIAFEEISLAIPRGGILGLVGESGSGKSTLARTIVRLVEPDAGRVVIDGIDVTALGGAALRRFRRHLQLIFQDSHGSLDPRMTIGDTLAEPLIIHRLAHSRGERRDRVVELLARVHLPAELARRRPHELSGGQRQRVGLARALAVGPRLLIADEPVSALDVSVQAQIVNLLADLQAAEGLTLLFISHDLRIVRHLCDRVAVMVRGRIVEEAPATALYDAPLHPYSAALLSAVPSLAGPVSGRLLLGEARREPPARGCSFEPRCPVRDKPPACRDERPALTRLGRPEDERSVACHLAESWRERIAAAPGL